jgi:hypothetical protein
MQANRDAGHYVAEYDQRSPDQQHPPAWPDLTFAEWLRLAFQGYTVPLDAWRENCRAAVEAAKAGNAKARDWLTRYLIGSQPLKLVALVADERAAYFAEEEIEQERCSRSLMRSFSDAVAPLERQYDLRDLGLAAHDGSPNPQGTALLAVLRAGGKVQRRATDPEMLALNHFLVNLTQIKSARPFPKKAPAMASLIRRYFTATDPKTGRKLRKRSAKWYGQYTDAAGVRRRVPLSANKTAAQQNAERVGAPGGIGEGGHPRSLRGVPQVAAAQSFGRLPPAP